MANNEFGALTLAELPEVREKTERIADFFQKRLRRQLDVLRMLLLPARVFGRYIAGFKDDIVGAEEAWGKLQEMFRSACGSPFSLPSQLESTVLHGLDTRVELYPWEYTLTIEAPKESKTVTVTSPLRWLLAYRSVYSPSQLRQVLASPGERKPESIQQFLLGALALDVLFERNPGLVRLLTELRYRVQTEKVPGLGQLPVTTIAAPIASFRPADDLILSACRLSGVHAFIELIDPAAVGQMQDPLREEVQASLQ